MSCRLALFGADHRRFGVLAHLASDDRRLGLAISAGARAERIAWWSKGDRDLPNEDACCIVDDGQRTMLAVADAHFGHRPSHDAITALLAADPAVDPAGLEALIRSIAAGHSAAAADDEAATALAIAVVDRVDGRGFGVVFGDATVAAVGAGGVVPLSRPADDFVTPGRPSSYRGAGRRFRIAQPPHDLLVAFSDGVDGCGGPGQRGIAAEELRRLARRPRQDAARFARALVRIALRGVAGHPGGHDNVAVVAAGPFGSTVTEQALSAGTDRSDSAGPTRRS